VEEGWGSNVWPRRRRFAARRRSRRGRSRSRRRCRRGRTLCRETWSRRRSRARFGARFTRRLGLDFANRVFERQALPGDVRFRQRRIDAPQLCDQSGARPFVKRPAAFTGRGAEPFDGAGYERIVVGHLCKLYAGFPKTASKLRMDFASGSCLRARGWSTARRPNSR
jgi:hypothetical protein